MARNKNGSATEIHIPLRASAADGTDAGDAIIQVDKCLSMMNHRLYRQCRNYEVSLQYVPISRSVTYEVEIYTFPDNYFVRGAIAHAYNTWKRSIQDELDAGVKLSRWYDFRINEQDPDSSWDFLVPAVFDGDATNSLTPDEYTETSVTGTDLSVEAFHMMGTISNSYNIFAEYAKVLNSRRATSPAVTSDESYAGLLPGGEDQEHLVETGDLPPYDHDFASYWDSGDILVLRDKLFVDIGNAGNRTVSRQFKAPLGMVYLRLQGDDSDVDFATGGSPLIMHCKPGSYMGVAADTLTE